MPSSSGEKERASTRSRPPPSATAANSPPRERIVTPSSFRASVSPLFELPGCAPHDALRDALRPSAGGHAFQLGDHLGEEVGDAVVAVHEVGPPRPEADHAALEPVAHREADLVLPEPDV